MFGNRRPSEDLLLPNFFSSLAYSSSLIFLSFSSHFSLIFLFFSSSLFSHSSCLLLPLLPPLPMRFFVPALIQHSTFNFWSSESHESSLSNGRVTEVSNANYTPMARAHHLFLFFSFIFLFSFSLSSGHILVFFTFHPFIFHSFLRLSAKKHYLCTDFDSPPRA